MDSYKHRERPTDDAEDSSKYEPILKFSYTNPHKIIKPVSNKAVTRWSPGEKYVEKNFSESKSAPQSALKSSPRYENVSDVNEDDSTYESIEYVDGVYKLKASEPLVMSSRAPQRAVTKNTISYSGHNNKQIMFSEMTYEERQEEHRRQEVGVEKGFPVYDYFAKSEAMKKNDLSPTQTHTRNNYSKWLLNEMNKDRNLMKLTEVRQKVSVTSAFREPQVRAATPTGQAAAAQDKPKQTAHRGEHDNQGHISISRSSVTEERNTNDSSVGIHGERNTNDSSVGIHGDETGEIVSDSDSRSESPFEFTSRRARFENADSVNTEESHSIRTDHRVTKEAPLYANVFQEDRSYNSSNGRKRDYNPASRQDEALPIRQDRQEASSPLVQDSTSYRYTLIDNDKITNDYRIDERQGYIEKIDPNTEGNIYDYPQMPPRPVEVRFSFQPEKTSKFQATCETLPATTSQQNIHLAEGSPASSTSRFTDHSFTENAKKSSTEKDQRVRAHSYSLVPETSKSFVNTGTYRRLDESDETGTAECLRAKSCDLMSREHSYDFPRCKIEKVKSSQFSSTSQKIHFANGSKSNGFTESSTTKTDELDSTCNVTKKSRKSRKDLFQEICQEREEKLEPAKFNEPTSVRRSQSFELDSDKAEKYEKKVSDMVKLFEELAQQQQLAYDQHMLQERYRRCGYDKTKTGSLHDVRIGTTTHNPFLFPNQFGTSPSLSASCSQLYSSKAIEHNRGQPKYGRDAITSSLASQNQDSGNIPSTEKTIVQGTHKLYDVSKIGNDISPKGRIKQTRGVDSTTTWAPKENVSKGLTFNSSNSEVKKSVRIAKTVEFKDDPPFFTTSTYSYSQPQRSEQMKKSDAHESTTSDIKNVSSLHYTHDPKVSAFEKYESSRTNFKAHDRLLSNEKCFLEKSPMTFAMLNDNHKPFANVPFNARNSGGVNRGGCEITDSENRSSSKGENYYVSSTVTMTRRHPQGIPDELGGSPTISNTFRKQRITNADKSKLRTASPNNYSDSIDTRSNLSTGLQPAQRLQQSASSPVPTRQMVARLHSSVNESMLDQGMYRCSSMKRITESERHFVPSSQITRSHEQEKSFCKSKAPSDHRVRPRSQSADPEKSQRKSYGVYGPEAFRVMSPGPAPHFVRMTEEARRKAEDYHVNSDQKLLNIFFDRLIEQHKYSSTSNLQAKRAIVEQSRFIRDNPGLLKQKASISNYTQNSEGASLSTPQTNTKLGQTLESSSSLCAANEEVTSGYSALASRNTVQKVSSGSSSSCLRKPFAQKVHWCRSSSSGRESESNTQNRIINSSHFRPRVNNSDEKNSFSTEETVSRTNMLEHCTGQPVKIKQPDTIKIVGRFQVQKRNTKSIESPAGPSSAAVFVGKEPAKYLQDVDDKNSKSTQKQLQSDLRHSLPSLFSASNRDSPSVFDVSNPRKCSDNIRTALSQRPSVSCYSPAPEYFQGSSIEYSNQKKPCTPQTSELKGRGSVSFAQDSSNIQTNSKISKEYSHSQELLSSVQRSYHSSSHDRERLLSPVPYYRISRSDIVSPSPQNVSFRALSPASSLFTDDRNWTPRGMSPSQFNSVVNIQTLERNTTSPVAHNDGQKDSNVLRFMVNNYDGMSDVEARKQMYFRSLNTDAAALKEPVPSLPQRSVGETEHA